MAQNIFLETSVEHLCGDNELFPIKGVHVTDRQRKKGLQIYSQSLVMLLFFLETNLENYEWQLKNLSKSFSRVIALWTWETEQVLFTFHIFHWHPKGTCIKISSQLPFTNSTFTEFQPWSDMVIFAAQNLAQLPDMVKCKPFLQECDITPAFFIKNTWH